MSVKQKWSVFFINVLIFFVDSFLKTQFLQQRKKSQSATVAIQLLNKIVSDERVHVRILSELAQSVAAEEGKEA